MAATLRKGKATARGRRRRSSPVKYPIYSLDKSLRVPRALLDQNAGKAATDAEAASFVGVALSGPYRSELSAAIKYGLLERPSDGKVAVTDLARKILRPQDSLSELEGLRKALLHAPVMSEVYQHYRGENLPDRQFLRNALVEKFNLPADKTEEFTNLFFENLERVQLIEEHQGRKRLLDISQTPASPGEDKTRLQKLAKGAAVGAHDSCFVMMPFAPPIGDYYSTVYEPAIKKAGLKPLRADAEIFGTGKIMDQIWSGINGAKVLVAELSGRNPNVFYELGLSHALEKPVVLVASNEEDVPFDLHHIRVIYYDMKDPFWGQKLIDKIAENILSAVKNPEEAIFKRKDASE